MPAGEGDAPADEPADDSIAGLPEVKKRSWLSIAQLVLVPIALLGLAALADELDWDALARQVADARWGLIALAFVLAQARQLGQTTSAKGASTVPLPNGPTYVLQLAIQYVNVMIPGGAARVALNVRYFSKKGLAAGSALAVAALDGLTGLVLQIIAVLGFLLVDITVLDLDLDLGSGPDDANGMRWLVGIVVVAIVIAGVALPQRRRDAIAWVRQAVRDAAHVTRGLSSPRRIGLLVGGNVAADIVLTLTLALCLRAFDQTLPLWEIWLIVVTVAVLAWFIPVPGGFGITEALLIIGLTTAGLPEEPVFAAVILYRIATFYLPPAWGFFALRRLERDGHI